MQRSCDRRGIAVVDLDFGGVIAREQVLSAKVHPVAYEPYELMACWRWMWR